MQGHAASINTGIPGGMSGSVSGYALAFQPLTLPQQITGEKSGLVDYCVFSSRIGFGRCGVVRLDRGVTVFLKKALRRDHKIPWPIEVVRVITLSAGRCQGYDSVRERGCGGLGWRSNTERVNGWHAYCVIRGWFTAVMESGRGRAEGRK